MRALALLLLFASPIAALAEDEPAPPNWSIGAGVSTTVIYYYPTTGSALVGSSPSAGGSIERRLSDSNWLVLGVDGSISDSTQGSLSDPSAETRLRSRQLFVNFGLRHVLTGRGAPVAVSLLTIAQGGYGAGSSDLLGTPPGETKNSSWTAGASVGLAIDRELSAGLTLRVATPVAGVWWQKSKLTTSDASVDGHSISAIAYLEPRLELRLAF